MILPDWPELPAAGLLKQRGGPVDLADVTACEVSIVMLERHRAEITTYERVNGWPHANTEDGRRVLKQRLNRINETEDRLLKLKRRGLRILEPRRRG